MRRNLYPYILLYLTSFLVTGSLFFLQQSLHPVHNYNNHRHFPANNNNNIYTTKSTTESSYVVFRKTNCTKSTSASLRSTPSSKHVTKSLDELAHSPLLNDHVLFLNGAKGCGTELLVLLMQRLQGKNGYIHYRLKGDHSATLNYENQIKMVDDVTHLIRDRAVPLTFDRHIYFVNFTKNHAQSPTFINMVRDPVDRFISRYFYKKAVAFKIKNKPVTPENLDESLEQCIKLKNKDCTFIDGQKYDFVVPYFCGQDSRCRLFNDNWALSTAKSNVEKYYSVVGVLEELNATLEMFENKHSYFFVGIQEVYNKDLLKYHYNNKRRPKIRSDLRKHFENVLTTEYNFYDWIKRRLFHQLQALNGHNH